MRRHSEQPMQFSQESPKVNIDSQLRDIALDQSVAEEHSYRLKMVFQTLLITAGYERILDEEISQRFHHEVISNENNRAQLLALLSDGLGQEGSDEVWEQNKKRAIEFVTGVLEGEDKKLAA